jgi:glycosyltransferase involved in cell wall biosynthesis
MAKVRRIYLLSPGAGDMYCGGCLRDNALAAALNALGQDARTVPLYLPNTLEDAPQHKDAPLFLGGVNVYLQQTCSIFRHTPTWLDGWLDSAWILNLAASRAGKTTPQDLGPLTHSMLQGVEGRQAKAIRQLAQWLRDERPDVVVLSNVLLAGLAKPIADSTGVPVYAFLGGEAAFLDALPEAWRAACWRETAAQAAHLAALLPPSDTYGRMLAERLGLPSERFRTVYPGIELAGYAPRADSTQTGNPPTLGYFARLCPDKGLDFLIEVFLRLRQRGRVPGLRLKAGGSLTGADQAFLAAQKEKLRVAGALEYVDFLPNASRAEKSAWIAGFDVCCVPAHYGEAFGLYLLEALACGVPVVAPEHAAFPEVLARLEGGRLARAHDHEHFAEVLEELLLDHALRARLGRAGRAALERSFTIQHAAQRLLEVFQTDAPKSGTLAASSPQAEARPHVV